jgi:hypothetical protein
MTSADGRKGELLTVPSAGGVTAFAVSMLAASLMLLGVVSVVAFIHNSCSCVRWLLAYAIAPD